MLKKLDTCKNMFINIDLWDNDIVNNFVFVTIIKEITFITFIVILTLYINFFRLKNVKIIKGLIQL